MHQHPRIYSVYKQSKIRILTAKFRCLPDFIIIGSQKCGTTSLYDFILKHPGILSAKRKELHFFSSLYDFGIDWYKSNFPLKSEKKSLQKKLQHKILTGEGTPYYIFHPLAPQRILKHVPDVKLIAILRNPVDRTYSHYNFGVRQNKENLTFEEAIKIEEKRLTGEREKIINDEKFDGFHFKHHSYLNRSHYADQLETWYRYFPKEQILILNTEELQNDPKKKILNQTFSFLGLPKYNPRKLVNLNMGEYSKMNPETREFLIEYFKPHNEKLYKLIGKNFDWDG